MLAATTTALAGLGALSGASASFLNAIRAMPDVAGTWSGDNPLAVREVADELRWKPWDTVAKEWDGVLKHEDKEQCADVAIIIARGTFDDGTVGDWVPPYFIRDLKDVFNPIFGQREELRGKTLAFQGVDSGDYPANLKDYIKYAGSENGAESMGKAVNKYWDVCKDKNTIFIIAGWSQGALVARKAFRHIEEDIREKRILSLTVWGDPYELFREEFADKFPANLPEKVSYIAECEMNKKPRTQAPAVEDGRSAEQQRPQGSFAQQVAWAVGLSPAVPDNPLLPEDPPDLLCARTDEGFPDVGTLFESTRKWIDWVKQQLMGVVVKFNIAHPYLAFVAFPKLLARLLFEAPFQFHLLALAIAQRDKTKISRWLLNPAHFFYGIDGKTRHSAISNLDAYLRFDLPAAS